LLWHNKFGIIAGMDTMDVASGARCAELRIVNANKTWRIVYRVDVDAVLIAEVFAKKTQATPKSVIDVCKQRLRDYDALTKGV